MNRYKILESRAPANEKQLNEYADNGWFLQLILPYEGKLYYHFMKWNL
jgi:hypothetical protein